MASLEKIFHLASESQFDAVEENVDPIDLKKVFALGDATKHDICVSSASPRASGTSRLGDVSRAGICHSYSHDGRCVSLLKTLYTNECVHECAYCSNSSSCRRRGNIYSYSPAELAKIMIRLYKGNYIEGLFLSSGIGSDEQKTMESIIETAKMLREKYGFSGYIHLKILPGTGRDQIYQCIQLADRVSVNLEVPSSGHMTYMSPTKDYNNDILRPQRLIQKISRKGGIPAGQTTQLVVGGAGETDKEIFSAVLREYIKFKLKRVYYSAFLPIEGTKLESVPEQPPWREHRLYQMDWLFRVYKFDVDDLYFAFDDYDRLDNTDPKLVIAKQTLQDAIDPNTAEYKELLKVPGIGPISAKRIIDARKTSPLKHRRELHYLGVVLKRASPFIVLDGWQDTLLERWMS